MVLHIYQQIGFGSKRVLYVHQSHGKESQHT